MRIGVLDLLRSEGRLPAGQRAYAHIITKQYASIMPQAVSVWCRQWGHEVFYATYFGQRAPERLLPPDLDVVFVASYTGAAPLAYALAKLFRAAGALTVIGGPHAKAFPEDCLRFFDVVVRQCDRTLVWEILHDRPVGMIVSSPRPLQDLPTVEERMPEIRRALFARGRPWVGANIPLLASVGCPYTCNFCSDWDTPYALLPADRLEADLRYIATHFPRAMVSFHDPNFAVKFDAVLGVLERLPPGRCPRYLIESSLSVLRGPRLERLRNTRCLFVAPGVESWTAYSNKSGVRGAADGDEKLAAVVEHFRLLHGYVPGIQANFIFGLDDDAGDAPLARTKEFIDRLPYVWPTVNIPVPFGGTPLYDAYLTGGRVLTAMPFVFYYAPYLVTTLANYDPLEYYDRLTGLYAHIASPRLTARRLRMTPGRLKPVWAIRSWGARAMRRDLRRLRDALAADPDLRAFHEGRRPDLPRFYRAEFDRILGPYAALLSEAERVPAHTTPGPSAR